MEIQRQGYLDKLISKRENGLIKIITGLRRSGKSYLLFRIYYNYLISIGVDREHIVTLALDSDVNSKYRNPLELSAYLHQRIGVDKGTYYILLDEIQMVEPIANPYLPDGVKKIGFTDVLLGLLQLPNTDIYVTGSNSRMLSQDIVTEFRGRGDEIRVFPLSFKEFYGAYQGEKHRAWREYCFYGGMPYILSLKSHEDKANYLQKLVSQVYISDVLERYRIFNDRSFLDDLLDCIASSVGSLTSTPKLANTFASVKQIQVHPATIGKYLDYFVDAFLFAKASRYNVKGRKYIGSPVKYYFTDVGLRNAKLNFRQQEENHLMENVIYNELCTRGYSVDVGVVEYNYKNDEGKSCRSQLEVDFVAKRGYEIIYVQSAYAMDTPEKQEQELRPLRFVKDSFKKIVIVNNGMLPHVDQWGIYHVDLQDFLLGLDVC